MNEYKKKLKFVYITNIAIRYSHSSSYTDKLICKNRFFSKKKNNRNFCLWFIIIWYNSQELPWDQSTKGLVLSAFYWGYPLTQVLVAQMAQKYGAKHFLAASVGICAILTLLTPQSAINGGVIVMCINQMLQGIAQVSWFVYRNFVKTEQSNQIILFLLFFNRSID